MKKVFCLVLAVLICASVAFPVLAADFVPSITYKGSPKLVAAVDGNGDDILGCLELIPVSKAKKMDTEEAKLLVTLYEELCNGTQMLPYDKVEGINADKMVVRELLNIICGEGHTHSDIVLTINLGIAADDVVAVMTYNDEWVPAENVVNNGDGTVSFTIEKLAPFAISVEA